MSDDLKVLHGKDSILTVYSNGHSKLESKYYDIKPTSSNPSLQVKLESLLTYLALDDVDNRYIFMQKYIEILNSITKDFDKADLEDFLGQIRIGELGNIYADSLSTITKQHKIVNKENSNNKVESNSVKPQQESFDVDDIDTTISNIEFSIELLDMDYDDLLNKNLKNPEDFHDLASYYEFELNSLRNLQNSANSSQKEKIKELIKKADMQRNRILSKAKKLDEISNMIALI